MITKKKKARALSFVTASLALAGCAAFGGAAAAVRVDATTNGYSDVSSFWSTNVIIVQDYQNLNNYFYDTFEVRVLDDPYIVSTSDAFDGAYVPVAATIDFDADANTMTLLSLRFARYSWPSGGMTTEARENFRRCVEYSPLPCFVAYSPSYDAVYLYAYRANTVSYFSSMSGSTDVPANDPLQLPMYFSAGRNYFVTGYPGQVPLQFDGSILTDVYEPLVYTLANSYFNSYAYQQGYNYGYYTGTDDGYANGYNVGYHQGQSDVSSGGAALNNIFGAVLSVPVDLFNGLSAFTLWGTPLITIGFTFLAFGIVIYIVKKVI